MNQNKKERLRSLYKVDEVLQDECLIFFKDRLPHTLVTDSVREEIELLRNAILNEDACPAALTDRQLFLEQVACRIRTKATPSLRPVINATGTVLHTNLGRSLLGTEVMAHISETSCAYSTLEYDLNAGKRGLRHNHVEQLICKVTGAEAAMVVNNNAAATMLVLSAMAAGQEVIVSRGELVEIGGSFRIPDIMRLSGAVLREVGTTNKTHLHDYADAVRKSSPPCPSVPEDRHPYGGPGCEPLYFPGRPATAALMKVHTSNYRIHGFTEDVPLEELRKLGDCFSLPLIYDMGNGLLINLNDYQISEPAVPDAVRAGADIVLFSGDKLLGGPQAGIIIGKKPYIDRMKQHPLARVVRIDKMTLAALETVFFTYQDPERALKQIPTLQMLTCSKESLYAKAVRLRSSLSAETADRFHPEIEPCQDFVGGGSAPDARLDGYAVTLRSDTLSSDRLERLLRKSSVPIISHINQDKIWLHMRTVSDNETEKIAESISQL